MKLYAQVKQNISLTLSHYFILLITLTTVHSNLPSQACEEHASFPINVAFILLIILMTYFKINGATVFYIMKRNGMGKQEYTLSSSKQNMKYK